MNIFVLLWFIGIGLTGFLPELPNLSYLLSGCVALIVAYLITRAKPINYLLAILIGTSYVTLYTNIFPTPRLPESLYNVPMIVQGTVASLPVFDQGKTQFIFKIKYTDTKQLNSENPFKIKVYWRDAPATISVGDTWSLPLKIKPIYSNRNPGSLDVEKYAYLNHVSGIGFVQLKQSPKLIQRAPWTYPVTYMRQLISFKLSTHFKDKAFIGPILAMAIGDTHLIKQETWAVFRETGTAHLMAISGLHIGLVAGFGYYLAGVVWKQYLSRKYRLSRQATAAFMACLFALIYALLAGFSLPTQRAFIMIVLVSVSLLKYPYLTLSNFYFMTLFLVLLINPLSIFFPSFWLSFGAVGLIFYGLRCQALGKESFWRRYIFPHYLLFIGLTPLTIYFFKQVAWTSMLANIIAIPVVSVLVVPFALLGTLLLPIPFISEIVMSIANMGMTFLWPVLETLSKWSADTIIHREISVFSIICVSISVIWLLAPKGFPGKKISLLLWLPILFPLNPAMKTGEISLNVLDIGQGLAVMVKTQNHTLLYDTGPPMGKKDAGEIIILPYLRAKGITSIDTVVISHPDADHIGGYQSLFNKMPINETLISDPMAKPYTTQTIPCRQGMNWRWDDVTFEILHPTDITTKKRNDHSCVLKISNQAHSILLTGDITQKSEKQLIRQYGQSLKSDILLVPHHGSKTSSSEAFIKSVEPVYALIASGYLNRYHHPSLSVVERYKNMGVSMLNTAKSGAIEILLRPGYNISPPKRYRIDHRHFWHT